MSLKKRIILILLVFSITPVLIMGLVGTTRAQRILEQQIGIDSLELARLTLERISEHLYSEFHIMRSWPHVISLAEAIDESHYAGISEQLANIQEIHNEYYSIVLQDEKGKIVASSATEMIGRNLSGEPAFREAIGGKPSVQDVAFNAIAGGWAVAISVPVMDSHEGSQVKAVLSAALKWDTVNEMVTSLKLAGRPQRESDHFMLLNSEGVVISCFDRTELFTENLIRVGMDSAKYALEKKEGSLYEDHTEHGLESFSSYTYLKKYKDLPDLGWGLVFLQDPNRIFASANLLKRATIYMLVVSVVVLSVISLAFAHRITKPILTIASAVANIGKGQLGTRVNVDSKDELGILASSFNAMANNLENTTTSVETLNAANQQLTASQQQLKASNEQLQFHISERTRTEKERQRLQAQQLRQTQKMEAIGTLAGGIAHDFNNILTVILGHADLAFQDTRDGTVIRSNLEQVRIAGSRAKHLIKQILIFSRNTEQEREPMKIVPIAEEALKMLRSLMPTTVEIRKNIETDSSMIIANPTEVYQILMNLCTNAAQAMGEKGGQLEVCLSEVNIDSAIVTDFGMLQHGSYVKLTVKDTGCGIENDVMERIFEPFFTTKGVDGGTGMGLSVVHGIIESYGGLVTVKSEPGKGTTFSVFFPRIESTDTQQAETSGKVPGGEELILLVDNEKPIVDVMTQMLERLGYAVVGETSSIDALEILRAEPGKFDLVITDYAMPDMTGKQIAKEIMNFRPDIPIILCSGFSEDIDFDQAKNAGIRRFVPKPIDWKHMATTIRNLLDNRQAKELP